MSLCVRYWKLLPVAMILYSCASIPSPVSPLPVTESTVNEKIDQLVAQLTQETPLFPDKMFAVAEFTDASDKKTALTGYLTDLLIDRLSKSGKIHLVERSRLDTVMNELDFSMTGYIEERSEKLLGRLIGADGIVTGKVIDLGDTLDVKVRLIQTETGKIIATAQVELVNDRKMQRLAGQAYEKPKTDARDKIQGLDQLQQATELVAKEDWQGLQKLAEPWTVSEPGNSLSWFHLGLAYGKLQQYDRAVQAYQEALRIEPNDSRSWNNLGGVYRDLKQYDKAVTAYRKALRINNNIGLIGVLPRICGHI
jgi:tetratricopeptide (TPR) repeat protein